MALLPAYLADQTFDSPASLIPNKYHSSTNRKSSKNSDYGNHCNNCNNCTSCNSCNTSKISKIVRIVGIVGIVGIVIMVEKPKTWIPNQNTLQKQTPLSVNPKLKSLRPKPKP